MSKGQVMLYGLMICVVVLVLAGAFAAPALTATSAANTAMNCSGTSDSYVKGACIITDMTSPYFIGTLICIGIAVLGAKLAFGGESIA